MSKRQPYDGATPYYGVKTQSEIDADTIEAPRTQNMQILSLLETHRKQLRENDDTIEALRAENAKLLEALKPFADEAKDYVGLVLGPDIDHWPLNESRLTLGHLRAARAAMGESDE